MNKRVRIIIVFLCVIVPQHMTSSPFTKKGSGKIPHIAVIDSFKCPEEQCAYVSDELPFTINHCYQQHPSSAVTLIERLITMPSQQAERSSILTDCNAIKRSDSVAGDSEDDVSGSNTESCSERENDSCASDRNAQATQRLSVCPVRGCNTSLAPRSWVGHFGSKHSNKKQLPYICDICNNASASITAIKTHIRTKHNVPSVSKQMWKCDAKRLHALQRRVRRARQGDIDEEMLTESACINCPKCKQGLASWYSLRQHYAAAHAPELNPYRCQVKGCGRSYAALSSIRGHAISTHEWSSDNSPIWVFDKACKKKLDEKLDQEISQGDGSLAEKRKRPHHDRRFKSLSSKRQCLIASTALETLKAQGGATSQSAPSTPAAQSSRAIALVEHKGSSERVESEVIDCLFCPKSITGYQAYVQHLKGDCSQLIPCLLAIVTTHRLNSGQNALTLSPELAKLVMKEMWRLNSELKGALSGLSSAS